jgi:ABC-type nitrate/sulfonate/bicarbonate transport system substrate-binding protein
MPMLRVLLAAVLAMVIGPVAAQTPITIGKISGGIGLHIPSYIAMDKGFFKEEGLDARFVELGGTAMIRAGLTNNLNFVPIPSGGAQAVLKGGAKIRYLVNQSLTSQYVVVARPELNKPEDLKSKTIGFARPGAADYDEGVTVLSRFFKMQVGRDYKVISLPGDPERIGALLNKDIDAAFVSAPQGVRAVQAGMKIVLRTGDHLPRVGGCFWVPEEYFEKNQDAVKKFIRAIAKGVMYFRDNKAGSLATIKDHLGIQSDEQAGLIWEELHNSFAAEMPKDLYREVFESRRLDLIAAKEWPADRPLPDPEQFLARALLDGEHDQAGEHDIDLIATGGLHHHHAEAGFGAEELRHYDAEHGAADRKPQACDDVGHGVGHHHEARDVPFLGAERSHHVDQHPVGVAHPLVGVDQDRKQRADEHDQHFRP